MAQNLDHLAALEFRVEISPARLDEVADLALRLNQRRARQRGAILSHAQRRAYSELAESEVLGMRSAVEEVLKALVLLDVVAVRT